MSGVRVTVVGDALLDVDVLGSARRLCPDAAGPVVVVDERRHRAGGAALAASMLAAAGCSVRLVTALGGPSGAAVAGLLEARGVEVHDLGRPCPTPTKQRVFADGQLVARLDADDEPTPPLEAVAPAAVRDADAVLVADYGRGVVAAPTVRDALVRAGRPVIWDPHPRGAQPPVGVALAVPSAVEAGLTPAQLATPFRPALAAAARLRKTWGADAVAVTLGAAGAVLVDRSGTPLACPAVAVHGGDPCGAGDAFAAAASIALASGALVGEAVVAAVAAATDHVARSGAGTWEASAAAETLASAPVPPATRSPEVVATSGCFDLLHAGHVAFLEQARRLGDRLVVLVNSDASVRRLKGSDRPLQPVADRVAVLSALAAVDQVEVFDEDTPARALERLRPAVFAKGGDYRIEDLPEAAVVARGGGTAVTLPYLAGRSTTRLVQEARRHGSPIR